MHSRCPCTLSTTNNKLPGKYDEDTGRLSKFSKINSMHIQACHFQNRLVGFRLIISPGMWTLGVWGAFHIITVKGTMSSASHIQCVSSCFILASSNPRASSKDKGHPGAAVKSMWRALRWSLATVRSPRALFLCVLECWVTFVCS